MTVRGKHGGPRPGSGRKSIFPGKDRRPVSISLTPQGRRLVKATARRLGISGSNVVEALLRSHAETLEVPELLGTAPVLPRPRTPNARITFLQDQTTPEVRARLAAFAVAYRRDWERWLATCEMHDLNDSLTILEFKRILGKWQAVRPRRLARIDEPIAGTKTLSQVVDAATRLKAKLGTVSLRTLPTAGSGERRALLDLWKLFASSLADNGEAGCVGITKAIMLVTGGSIGPALDSRVRQELRIPSPTTGDAWLGLLDDISRDLMAFESASGETLESLVQGPWRSVGVGRAYDMAAGPRAGT